MTSFNSIALNGSTLTVNGTDYNLSLSQTAEGTDSSLSSFKGVAAVDNGDGTISLTVGENSVVVEKYETASGYTVTFADEMQWNTYSQDLDAKEYSVDGGVTWQAIPTELPFSIEASSIMLRLQSGWSGNIKPRARCTEIGLDTGYVNQLTITQNYVLNDDVVLSMEILYDD